MSSARERTAIARAEFFLSLAEQCRPEQRQEFEAFLEAAIVFSRAALHRLKAEFESHELWAPWFANLKNDPSIEFFRKQRDFLLKEASPKVGQVITFNQIVTAAQLYYFEDTSSDTAAETVRKHFNLYSKILIDGDAFFRKSDSSQKNGN